MMQAVDQGPSAAVESGCVGSLRSADNGGLAAPVCPCILSIAEILAGIRKVSRLGLSNAPKGFFRRLGAKINFLLIFPTKPAPLRRRIHRFQSKAISAAFHAAWGSRLS